MVNKWRLEELAELAEVIDSRHKTPKYSESGYPMVRVVDVNGGALRLKDTKRVSQEVYDDFSRGRDPEVGDLVITRVGTYGTVSYVNSDDKFCLGQNTAFIIPKINSRFLYYQLISPLVKNQIEQYVVGAVQKTISLKNIRGLLINLPSDKEQKAIAHILGTLDNKIELNRQMNETLEAMAQALFKSWFVDFDPVIDNALLTGKAIPKPLKERAELRQAQLDSGQANSNSQINDLFPSEFEFTEELGWIPKGWEVGKFSDLAKLNPESWSKKNIPNEILYVDLGNTNNGKIDSITPYSSVDAPSRAKRVLTVDDTIIGTVRPGNRSFAYIHNYGLTGSTGFAVMRPLEPKNRSYIYLGLTQDKVIDYFSSIASGSAYPAINSSVVADLECVIPPANLLESFDTKAYAFINKIGMNNNYNETLAKLRDTLLPKLMSGELRIADAEKLVENI